MTGNDFETYRRELESAGPEMAERIMHRAEQEGELTGEEYQRLVELVRRKEAAVARCRRCVYGTPVMIGDGHEMMFACTQVLYTGRPRPCPSGAGCTVFEARDPARWAGEGSGE